MQEKHLTTSRRLCANKVWPRVLAQLSLKVVILSGISMVFYFRIPLRIYPVHIRVGLKFCWVTSGLPFTASQSWLPSGGWRERSGHELRGPSSADSDGVDLVVCQGARPLSSGHR